MDQNVTANLRALARESSTLAQDPLEDKRAKARARRKVDREIGKKHPLLRASLRLFAHVIVISTALLVTDWVFNNGLQTQLIYHGSSSGSLVSVLKNKAYHVNAFVKQQTEF